MPVIIIIVLIVAFAAGYLAGIGKTTTATTTATQVLTVTSTTSRSTSATASPLCVTLGNCPYSFIYIPYGASNNIGPVLNPASITVVIGVNNTVTWENLDTVPQTMVGANNLFNTGTLAPGQMYTYTFTTVGAYTYSSPTYSFEKGTVTVVQSTATTSAVGSNPDDNY